MADTGHSYKIDLEVVESSSSKQAFKAMQDAAKDTQQPINEINKTFNQILQTTEDTAEVEKQYNKVIAAQLAAEDKKLEKLKAEKIAITTNKDLTEDQKKEMLAMHDSEIERIKKNKQYIKAKEQEAKLLLKMNKLYNKNFDVNSKEYKSAVRKVQMQEKLNALLGKESKLRKAAAKVASTAIKVGGVAAGAAVGAVGAVLGASAQAAQGQVDKENALKSLKSGIDTSIADQVYIKTGADYQSIVAAVNNLSAITKDNGLLVQGAVLELQNPGIGKLLLSTSSQNAGDIVKLKSAIDTIKKTTGIQDISAALEAATKSSAVSKNKVSQVDYLNAYSVLSQAGLDEDAINKAINNVSSMPGKFRDNFNKTDFSKFTNDAQQKIRLNNNKPTMVPTGLGEAISASLKSSALGKKLGLGNLVDKLQDSQQSSAEHTAETLRSLELKKNEMLVKLIPIVDKIITALDKVLSTDTAQKIANGLVDFLVKVVPKLASFITDVFALIEAIAKKVTRNDPLDTANTKRQVEAAKQKSTPSIIAARSGLDHHFAQGGLALSPSICGEAGPELVLPLDNSRSGRIPQIINNYNTNQSFNMNSNQSTPLAFSQAIGQNRFVKRSIG